MALIHRVRTIVTGVTGSPWYINTHWDAQADADPTPQVQAMTDFWGAIKSYLDNACVYRVQPDVPVIETTDDQIVAVLTTDGSQTTGTGTTSALPYANQMLVRMQTGVYASGRQVRGRLIIPGPTATTSTVDGTISSSVRAAIDTAAAALTTSADESFRVYSKRNGAAYPVSTASTWEQYSILRSRRD